MYDENAESGTKSTARRHSVTISGRRILSVSGVISVDSFDDGEIIAVTEAGLMTITGGALHINKLTLESGDMSVEGTIIGINYTDDTSIGKDGKKNGFFGNLFK
ncbi:hypothetical protein FACS1894219_02680 [Clostridia bacterium]|nr:hypothetical protein FACS1894219_02680 [Clostridia bacterium]